MLYSDMLGFIIHVESMLLKSICFNIIEDQIYTCSFQKSTMIKATSFNRALLELYGNRFRNMCYHGHQNSQISLLLECVGPTCLLCRTSTMYRQAVKWSSINLLAPDLKDHIWLEGSCYRGTQKTSNLWDRLS